METEINEICINIINGRILPQVAAINLFKILYKNLSFFKDSSMINEILCCLLHLRLPAVTDNSNSIIIPTWYDTAEHESPRYNFSSKKYISYKYTRCVLKNLDECIKLGLPKEFTLNKPAESFMKTKFHPAPIISAFFTENLWNNYINLCSITETESFNFPTNPWELRAVIDQIKQLLGFPIEKKQKSQSHNKTSETYKKTKDTITVIYKLDNENTRKKKLHPEIYKRGFFYYKEAIKMLGILEGRWINYFSPAMTSICAEIDKKGLIKFFLNELEQDIMTNVFCALQVSILSTRKHFTLIQQQQGCLNEHSKKIFDVLCRSETTNWNLIALIYPTKDVIEKASLEHCTKVYNLWKFIGKFMSDFLKTQIDLGVGECISKGMMVPRIGKTKIDSTGWNQISGSWNNMLRQIKLLSIKLNIKPLVLFKCLKLTAGDQMSWADNSGKGIDPTALVFQNLYEKSYLPWSAYDPNIDQTLLYNEITNICNNIKEREGERPMYIQWLGETTGWSTETKQDTDTICGVPVNVSANTAFILKSIGIFGAKKPYWN